MVKVFSFSREYLCVPPPGVWGNAGGNSRRERRESPGGGTYKNPAVWNHLVPNLELRESGGVLQEWGGSVYFLFILTDRVLLASGFHPQSVRYRMLVHLVPLNPWEAWTPNAWTRKHWGSSRRSAWPSGASACISKWPQGEGSVYLVFTLCLPPWWLLALVSWLSKAFLLPHAWMGAVSFHWSVKHCSSSSW